MAETFSKAEKLKSSKLIEVLFAEGKSIKKFPIKLIYIPINNPNINCHKIAVAVPKRNFKLAVHRNKLKRLLREVYRKNKYLLSEKNRYYACMFLYIGKKEESYAVLHTKMEKLLLQFIEQEKLR